MASCAKDHKLTATTKGHKILFQFSVYIQVPDAGDLCRPCQPASKVPTGCEATSQPSSDTLLGITGYCAWPACTDACSTSRSVDTSTQHPSSFCISHTQSSHSHSMLTPLGRASYLVPTAHSLAIFILWIPAPLPVSFCLLLSRIEAARLLVLSCSQALRWLALLKRPPSQQQSLVK